MELSAVCKKSPRQIAENNLPCRRAKAEKVGALSQFGDVIGARHQGCTGEPVVCQAAAAVAVAGTYLAQLPLPPKR